MSDDSLSGFIDQSNEIADDLAKELLRAILLWKEKATQEGVPPLVTANASFRASTMLISFVTAIMSIEAEGETEHDFDELSSRASVIFSDLLDSMDGFLEKHVKGAVVVKVDRRTKEGGP